LRVGAGIDTLADPMLAVLVALLAALHSTVRSRAALAAEILALRHAAQQTGNYRLEGSTLYCTLEPCVMCAGALVTARVKRLVFGARDLRFGGVRSKFQIADAECLNHRVEVVEGVLGVECVELLREFFEVRR
jgi:tRNA(adenine34) deaminase